MLTTTQIDRYGNSLIFSGDLAMLDCAARAKGQPIMNKSMLRSFLVFAGSSAVLALQTSVSHAQSGPTVWVVPALTRVAGDDAPGNRREIELWAARGEYESFQVVVHAPAGGLKNVNVAISDLGGERGRITKASLALYREHYVHVTHGSPDRGGSNRPLGPGWYPDALIPLLDTDNTDKSAAERKTVPFDLGAASNQPVWVDVFVPRNAEPGQYRGTITVSSDQGAAALPVAVNV